MIKFDVINKIFSIKCDTCEEEIEFEADNFKQGIALAKKDNWLMKNINGENCSFCCSECKKRYIEMNSFVGY